MYEVVIQDVATMQGDDLAERLLVELDHLSAQDQIVQEIVWGDEDITASVEEFLARSLTADQGPLVIRSVSASQLLEETVTASVDQLQALAARTVEVVHHLRCGTDDKAFAQLPELFDGLQSLGPLLEVLGNRGLLPVSHVEKNIEELGQTLDAMMTAWHNENFVEVADLLKYELHSQLIQSHDTMSELAVNFAVARLTNRL